MCIYLYLDTAIYICTFYVYISRSRYMIIYTSSRHVEKLLASKLLSKDLECGSSSLPDVGKVALPIPASLKKNITLHMTS